MKIRQLLQKSSWVQSWRSAVQRRGMQMGRPVGRDGERRHDHGDDAGNVQVAVGQHEAR